MGLRQTRKPKICLLRLAFLQCLPPAPGMPLPPAPGMPLPPAPGMPLPTPQPASVLLLLQPAAHTNACSTGCG